MRLADIHAALEAGHLLSGDRAFATLVAIEQLAVVEGVPVSALGLAAPEFALSYPLLCTPNNRTGLGRPQYRAWRKMILDAQMLAAPDDVDGHPWLSLVRAETLAINRRSSTLYDFRNHLPSGTSPREVTDTLVGESFHALPKAQRHRFRAGFAAFLRLFDKDLARRTGLLPHEKPTILPTERDHFRLGAMAPELRDWRGSLTSSEAVRALDYLNRLCVAAGRLDGASDTLEDLRRSLPDLPDPESLDLPRRTAASLRNCVTQLLRAMGGPDPHLNDVEQAWSDLRKAARAAGCETSAIWAIGKPAATRGIPPSQLTAADVNDIMRSYRLNSMPAMCRKGCTQFDALRGRLPGSALPPEPLGIRHVPRHLKPPLEPTRATLARQRAKGKWKELYSVIRTLGWSSTKISSTFRFLRTRCLERGYAPQDLTLENYQVLEACASRTEQLQLRNAVRHLRALGQDDRRFAMFLEVLPEITMARSHGGVPKNCEKELEDLLDFMNVVMSTRRSYRVAVGVVADALKASDICLPVLLHADMLNLDLGSHEPRRSTHVGKLRSLREFRELPWTKAWRELQSMTVASGIGAKNNPIPKVLAWYPGTEPNEVTLVWAQKLDRELRSTIQNPPHGRADKAKALARHLATFDKLHDLPKVAASGLLPPKIGQIR